LIQIVVFEGDLHVVVVGLEEPMRSVVAEGLVSDGEIAVVAPAVGRPGEVLPGEGRGVVAVADGL
jgi:hypothetical protein